MKKLLLLPVILLMCFTINAQDSVDYKWTVQGDSNFAFVSGDGYSGGQVNAMALYSFTDALQAGARFGFGFGDYQYDAAISIAARYFLTESWFAYGEYGLTDTAIDGAALGAGYRVKIGERIEFNPTLSYALEYEEFGLTMGFAIRF
ncbi:MAG: hypothetical protein ACON4X_09355 [Polaribacter sp.]